MIHGLYSSATGIMTNSHRQDVIANNIANSETVGFKKDLALFQQRRTEAQARGLPSSSNRILEKLGGGILAAPTQMDTSQGDLERTENNLDIAIRGPGYFQVNDNGQPRLTRDGRFTVDPSGQLAMINAPGRQILDDAGRPIQFDRKKPRGEINIDEQGVVRQGNTKVARLAVVDATDRSKLQKVGDNLLSYPSTGPLQPSTSTVHSGNIERSNVDPARELTQLMDAQRQLEANANMIRVQDATLARLVNDVGRIS